MEYLPASAHIFRRSEDGSLDSGARARHNHFDSLPVCSIVSLPDRAIPLGIRWLNRVACFKQQGETGRAPAAIIPRVPIRYGRTAPTSAPSLTRAAFYFWSRQPGS